MRPNVSISLVFALCMVTLLYGSFHYLKPWLLVPSAAATDSEPTIPPIPSTAPHPSNVPLSPEPTGNPTTPPVPTLPGEATPSNNPSPTTEPTVSPSASANPTQSPVTTPTPTSNSNSSTTSSSGGSSSSHRSRMTHSGPTCEDRSLKILFETWEDLDRPDQDVEITFTYNDNQKTVRKTNNLGKAEVTYLYSGPGTIKATATDGYAEQSFPVDDLKCTGTGGSSAQGAVLGTSTTTLAPASSLPVGVELYTVIGTALSVAGLGLKWLRRG